MAGEVEEQKPPPSRKTGNLRQPPNLGERSTNQILPQDHTKTAYLAQTDDLGVLVSRTVRQ